MKKILLFIFLTLHLCNLSAQLVQFPQMANGQAGESLTAPTWLYRNSGTLRYHKADADMDTMAVVGVSFISATTPGDFTQVYFSGYALDWPTALRPGATYYLSTTAGTMTSEKPTSGSYQKLGIAADTFQFIIQISPRIEISSGGGGGVTDGNKGDISISSTGAAWAINSAAVTNAKMADMTGPAIKGKVTGTGAPEDLTPAQVNTMLGARQMVTLPADVTTSLNTLSDVTGMSFTAEANKTYIVELMGVFKTASLATVGIGLALDIPSGTVSGLVVNQLASQTNTSMAQIADNATAGTTSSNGTGTSGAPTTNFEVPIHGRWLVTVGGTGGTVQLRIKSEIAGAGVGLYTANPSVLFYQKIN